MDIDNDRLITEDEHMDYEEESPHETDEMMVEDGEEIYEGDEEPMEAEPIPLVSPFTNINSPSNPNPFIALPFLAPTPALLPTPGSATSAIVDLPEEDMTPVQDVNRVEMFEGIDEIEEIDPLIKGGETGEEVVKVVQGEGIGPSTEAIVQAETSLAGDLETGHEDKGELGLGEEELGLGENEIDNTEETQYHEVEELGETGTGAKEMQSRDILDRGVNPVADADAGEKEKIGVNANDAAKEVPVSHVVIEVTNGDHDDEPKDGSEVQDEAEEDYYDDEGEENVEEDSEEDDIPLTIDTLPPIILHLPTLGARTLFEPLPDDELDMKLPVWLADRQAELGEAKLSEVWGAIREELEKEGRGIKGAEMVIVEKQTNLKMGEDDKNLQDITLLQLLQLHHSCELAEPVQLYIEMQSDRFITRFNAIQREVHSQAERRRESILAIPGDANGPEEDEQQVEEGEGEEYEHEGDQQAEEDEEKADEREDLPTEPERSGRKRAADEESVESESQDRVRRRRQEDYEQERQVRAERADDERRAQNGDKKREIRPIEIASEHPNADWARGSTTGPMEIHGKRIIRSKSPDTVFETVPLPLPPQPVVEENDEGIDELEGDEEVGEEGEGHDVYEVDDDDGETSLKGADEQPEEVEIDTTANSVKSNYIAQANMNDTQPRTRFLDPAATPAASNKQSSQDDTLPPKEGHMEDEGVADMYLSDAELAEVSELNETAHNDATGIAPTSPTLDAGDVPTTAVPLDEVSKVNLDLAPDTSLLTPAAKDTIANLKASTPGVSLDSSYFSDMQNGSRQIIIPTGGNSSEGALASVEDDAVEAEEDSVYLAGRKIVVDEIDKYGLDPAAKIPGNDTTELSKDAHASSESASRNLDFDDSDARSTTSTPPDVTIPSISAPTIPDSVDTLSSKRSEP